MDHGIEFVDRYVNLGRDVINERGFGDATEREFDCQESRNHQIVEVPSDAAAIGEDRERLELALPSVLSG